MKILQLVSDWKWTGPAEPMLVLVKALRERGHQVDLVCPEPSTGSTRSLWNEACLRGIDPVMSIEAARSAVRWGDASRVDRLAVWLETNALGGPYDIVHCWHSRDHVLAARALRRGVRFKFGTPRATGPGRRGTTRIVRSLSHAEPISNWPWNRWLFGVGCDGLVCVSEGAAQNMRGIRLDRLTASTTGAIDLAELAVHRTAEEIRAELAVDPADVLVGVVARMQPHRRFDLLLAALADLVRTHPNVRLVIIGRGTRAEELVRAPARAMGLEDHVVLAGYRVADYADVLAAMDFVTYLVPGSDGTCRALLQAAALGLPSVGSWRGAVPEIVSNGQTGILVTENPDALSAAWRSLVDDPVRRREMGEAARADARERFRPDRHAAWMERFYEEARCRDS